MSLMPKRVKWRKQHRGKTRGIATSGHTVAFGGFGLQSLEPGWPCASQRTEPVFLSSAMIAGVS